MLRPLPFITVRQEQSEPAQAAPLGFARADELVDDDLRAVREVTELAFPDHQGIRLSGRVTVLEAHDGFFREHRVDHLEARLTLLDVLERDVRFTVLLVVKHGVTMEERAATRILTRETHTEAVFEQRGIRK